MGSCFSASSFASGDKPTAKVISLDGKLIKYSLPVNVMQVLSADYRSCFLCEADAMYYDSYIPPLGFAEWLQLDGIYFVLPMPLLDHPLTGREMAALAVKASCALNSAMGKSRRRRRIPRVISVLEVDDASEETKSRQQYKIGISPRAPRGFKASTRLSTITEVE